MPENDVAALRLIATMQEKVSCAGRNDLPPDEYVARARLYRHQGRGAPVALAARRNQMKWPTVVARRSRTESPGRDNVAQVNRAPLTRASQYAWMCLLWVCLMNGQNPSLPLGAARPVCVDRPKPFYGPQWLCAANSLN